MPPPLIIDYLFHLYYKYASGTAFGQKKFKISYHIMLIQHKEDGQRGIYYIEDEGSVLAEIVYTNAQDNQLLIIEHTEVDDALRGQNIGYALVNKVVEHARSYGQKVAPVCTFAKAVFDRKPELQDVLAQ
jgi:predicted GNAT family acetyltransferase